MSYPDSIVQEMSLDVASEILTKLSDDPTNSPGLTAWLGFLRGDRRDALAQGSMFSGEAK